MDLSKALFNPMEKYCVQMPELRELEPKYITIDAVRYLASETWPSPQLDSGFSIERIFVNEFGNEPRIGKFLKIKEELRALAFYRQPILELIPPSALLQRKFKSE